MRTERNKLVFPTQSLSLGTRRGKKVYHRVRIMYFRIDTK